MKRLQMLAFGGFGCLLVIAGCQTRTDQKNGEKADQDSGTDSDTGPEACLQVGWQWQNPLPQGNPLHGLWGSGPKDLFAVGEAGTILHYDGETWTRMASGTTRTLTGVWGASPNDVFAVSQGWSDYSYGYSDDGYEERGVILHYDGEVWSRMETDIAQDIRFISLTGVFGTAPNNVFAVGFWGFGVQSGGLVLHYDGALWTDMDVDVDEPLYAVWGTSSNDVFAVGPGATILHYDGTQWSRMDNHDNNPNNRDLFDVWGTAPDNVFAVGGNGNIFHFDGVDWARMESGTEDVLFAVWGTSTGEVFAGGHSGDGKGYVLRYDGANWSPVFSGELSPNWEAETYWPPTSAFDIWGLSGDDLFVVGQMGSILHFDGSVWSPISSGVPLSRLIDDPYSFIWGEAEPEVVSPAIFGTARDNIYAVGNQAILHFDGTRWSPMEGAPEGAWNSVYAAADDDVFVVGYDATVAHYDGRQWTTTQLEGHLGLAAAWYVTVLKDVFGTSGTDVYAVGDGIFHYDGAAWTQVEYGFFYSGVAFAPNDVFVVGDGITHYDGTQWRAMYDPSIDSLVAVWGSSPRDVFAVGNEIVHYDGTRWTSMETVTDSFEDIFYRYDGTAWWGLEGSYWLQSVFGTAGNDVYAVGFGGLILHYNGARWRPMASGTSNTLYGVWAADQGEVFAVGLGGTILHHEGCTL